MALLTSMIKLRLCIAAIFLGCAVAAFCNEESAWLQLNKSSQGFLFEGITNGELFSFDLPGKTVKTAKDNGRAYAMIDGVAVQLFRADRPAPNVDSALKAYRKSETAYLERAGGVLTESTICSELKVPHEEWGASLRSMPKSIYLVISLKDHLLVAALAGSDETVSKSIIEEKLAALCASFAIVD